MKMLKKIALTLVVVPMLGFAGCGEHEAVKEMNSVADKICACEDLKCVQEAAKDLEKLAEKHKDTKVSEADKKKVEEAGKKAMKCVTENTKKFMSK